jgi:hypothetical protein
MSMGSNGLALTLNNPNAPVISAWANNLYQIGSTFNSPRQNNSYIAPAFINNPISFDHIRLPLSVNIVSTSVATTANTTFSLGLTYAFYVGMYTTGGTNATSLKSAFTTSGGITQRVNFQAGTAGSQYSVTNAFTWPVNGTNATSTFSASYAASTSNMSFAVTQMSAFTGMKHFEMPSASSLPPNMYWVMMGVMSTSATQAATALFQVFLSHSHLAFPQIQQTYGFFGQASNISVANISGVGSYQAPGGIGSGTLPAGLGFSDITAMASSPVNFIYMEYDG